MKYRICNRSGSYWQEFESFNDAWDFIERFIPRFVHQELYVVGDQ